MPSSELEEEGIPDHVGPLPGKEATGDAQEGISPPGDAPVGSDDLATTAEGQRGGDSLDERMAREVADLGEEQIQPEQPGREEHRGEGRRTGRVVEPSGEGAGPDLEKDEVGDERTGDRGGYSAEERAVRAREGES